MLLKSQLSIGAAVAHSGCRGAVTEQLAQLPENGERQIHMTHDMIAMRTNRLALLVNIDIVMYVNLLYPVNRHSEIIVSPNLTNNI